MNKQLVLFVDDEEKVLKAWRRAFETEPYNMLFANSAEEALKIMSNLEVAVVVSDYSMPNIDGLKLLEKIRDLYPSVTTILVSGHATLQVASEAINNCGIYKLFQKPCSKIDLALSIRDGLKKSQTNRDDSSLFQLERRHPGITKVSKDRKGVIII